VIAREIFVQEAQARGLDASDEYKNQLELTKQSILIRELFGDFQKKNPVTDEEPRQSTTNSRLPTPARNTAHATSW